VVDALFNRLAHAEHHRGRGAHPQLVSGAVDAEPVPGVALQARHAPAHVVVENLRAAAGNRIQARVPQPENGLAQRQAGILGDGQDLRGRQAMQPDLRKALFDAAEKSRSNQSIFRSG
jgi:hypothetical protein